MVCIPEDIRNISSLRVDDVVIAFMGPTGAGKSSIIDVLTGEHHRSGSSLISCTNKVNAVRLRDHEKYGSRIVLVDTPGFDDTNRSDLEILTMISDWLKKTYKANIKLAGIAYLHRITDNRMAGSPYRNLHIFGELCGPRAAKNIFLVTTMWDLLDEQDLNRKSGDRREKELHEKYWSDLIKNGASTARFSNDKKSAWEIVDRMLEQDERVALLLQEELVELQRRLNETGAGKALYATLRELLLRQKQNLVRLSKETESNLHPKELEMLNSEYKRIQSKISSTLKDVKALKIPITRMIYLFFAKQSRAEFVVKDILMPVVTPA